MKIKIKKSIFSRSFFFLSLLFFSGGCFSFVQANTKWYPGHYIFIMNNSVEGMYKEVGDIPAVRGVQRSYYWDDLEPTKGSYDFSKIIEETNYLKERGWKMIIQIQTRTFGNGTQNQRIPAYLKTAEYNYGAYYATNGASTVLYGDDKVFERFTALLRAMGTALDSNPVITGVNMHESGISAPATSHWLYPTWDAYRTKHGSNLLRIDQLGREVFPTTPFVQYYGGGVYPRGLEPLALQKGFGIGNPDVVLNGWYTLKPDGTKYSIRGNYEAATRLAGSVPLIYSIQSPDYAPNEAYVGKPNTTLEVQAFLRDVLKTNMATWAPTWGDNKYHWDYVKEFLKSLPTRYPNDPAGGLNSTCPTLIAPCISENPDPSGPPSLSLKTPPSPIVNNPQSLLEIQTNQSGTLSFTGDCSFTPTAVQAGSTFLTLTNQQKKTYSNCKIILTNSQKEQSIPLTIPSFTLSYRSDLNHDRKVDIFDFTIFVANFGKNECSNIADINNDCKVDIFDFTIFLGEFGRGIEDFALTAELTASPSVIISGQQMTLTWNSTNTTSCIGTNFNTNNQTSGSVTLSPTNTTTYILTCEGSGGSVNRNVTIQVTQPKVPEVVFNASSIAIVYGQSTTLTWSSTNTTSCIGINFDTNNQISGNRTLIPPATTTYTITCKNALGQEDTKSILVSVENDKVSYPVVPGKYSTLLKNFADTAIRDGRDTYGTVRSDVFVDGLTVAIPHKPVMWEIDDAYHEDTGYPKQSYLCNAVSFTPFSRLLRELTKITNDTVYSNASRSAVKQILSTQLHVNGLAFWGPHSSWDCLNDEYTGHTSLTTGNKPTPLHEMKNTNLDYRYMYSINPIATTTYIQQFWNASVKDWTNLDYTRHPTFSVPKKAVFGEDAKTTVDKIVKNITLPYITQQSKFSSVQSELLLSAFMYNYLTGSQKAWDAADTLNQYQMRMRNSVTKLGPPRYAYKEGHDGQQNKINTEQLVGFGDIVGRYLAGVNVLLTMAELSSDATKKEYFLKYANEELTAWADYKHISGTSTYKYAVYLDGKRVNNINGNYRGDGFVMFYNYAKAYRMTGNVKYWNMARDIFDGYELGSLANTPNGVPQLDFVTPYKIFTIVNESQKRYDGFIIHGLLELYRATENRKYLEMSAKVADDIVAQLFKNNLPLFVPNARNSRLGEMWPLALADIEAAIQDKRLEVDAIHPRGDMIFHSEHKTLRDTFDGTKRIRDNLLYMQTSP